MTHLQHHLISKAGLTGTSILKDDSLFVTRTPHKCKLIYVYNYLSSAIASIQDGTLWEINPSPDLTLYSTLVENT